VEPHRDARERTIKPEEGTIGTIVMSIAEDETHQMIHTM
jgi:hypothetical protein